MQSKSAQSWTSIARLATHQHGSVTRRQLIDHGLTPSMIQIALARGRLFRLHRGVFAVGYVGDARESRWSAAVLACGEGALLNARSAGCLWGFRAWEPWAPDVLAPTRAGRARPGISVHRCTVEAVDIAEHRRIPVTSPARTIVDLAHYLTVDELQWALREMQYLRLFDLDAVGEVLSRRPSRKLQPLVDDLFVLRNGFEADLLGLCDRYDVPRPAKPRKIEGVKVDFHWPGPKVIVETDGWWAHSTFNAFQQDRSNTNLLQLHGWLVLRFTFADVTKRPAQTARAIKRALGRVLTT
jgi:hypothetical protein